jgi:hypothetical protein
MGGSVQFALSPSNTRGGSVQLPLSREASVQFPLNGPSTLPSNRAAAIGSMQFPYTDPRQDYNTFLTPQGLVVQDLKNADNVSTR